MAARAPRLTLRSSARSAPTWPVAAGSLVLGFAVAEVTGVRAIGGIVLIAAVGWCALQWRAAVGPRRAAALVGIYVFAFAASHVLGLAIGAWPSVATVAVLTGLATWSLADSRATA